MEHHGCGRVRSSSACRRAASIGFRSSSSPTTRGTGIVNTLFDGYAPWHGADPGRTNGAMVADREGVATPYALFHLQERGVIFVPAGTAVYEGMVVGEYSRDNDLDVNVCREKKLTNMRATGHDEAALIPPRADGPRGRPRVDRRGRARRGDAGAPSASASGSCGARSAARAAQRAHPAGPPPRETEPASGLVVNSARAHPARSASRKVAAAPPKRPLGHTRCPLQTEQRPYEVRLLSRSPADRHGRAEGDEHRLASGRGHPRRPREDERPQGLHGLADRPLGLGQVDDRRRPREARSGSAASAPTSSTATTSATA